MVIKVEIFKSMANGNGNICNEKKLLNGRNGHYMDWEIKFMGYHAGINNIGAILGM